MFRSKILIVLLKLLKKFVRCKMSLIKKILVFIINQSSQFARRFPYLVKGTYLYCLDKIYRSKYETIAFDELLARKKSDTVFICGTGPSVSDISTERWRQMEKHDVLSFRDFHKQNYVSVDFHVTGEVDNIYEYSASINGNEKYNDTIFVVQEGRLASQGNALISKRLLRPNSKVFRYKRKSRGEVVPLSNNLNEGIVHGFNSVTGMINIAYLFGWKKIVLVGIDMNGHQYFYHPADQVRSVEKEGINQNSPYTNVDKSIELIQLWKNELDGKNIDLYVLSSKSELSKTLPLYGWPE